MIFDWHVLNYWNSFLILRLYKHKLSSLTSNLSNAKNMHVDTKYGVLSHDNEKSHSFFFSHDHGPFPSNPVLCHGKLCFVLDHTEVGILS